jgi:pimeloyl-ACP methyl ester carboxylesterase
MAGLILVGIFTAFGGLRQAEEGAVSEPAGSSSISQPAIREPEEIESESPSTRWFKSSRSEGLEGVALVIHGLNLRPDRMQPVINSLTGNGIDVLGLSLRGHGENYARRDNMDDAAARLESFKNVSYPLWTNEAYLAYKQAQKRAQKQKVPLFLTAFSIGALIGLDLFASHGEVYIDRMVLLAPAISLRAVIYIERVVSPFPRLVIPSMADDNYLSNQKGTPVAAYNALFEALYHFEDTAGPKLNVPTLIFIDEQDEFIPTGGLRDLAEKHQLDKWRFYIVRKQGEMATGTFHHHIIDAHSTGKKVWQDMMTATVDHLLGNLSE